MHPFEVIVLEATAFVPERHDPDVEQVVDELRN
jgi:hypothetical protein